MPANEADIIIRFLAKDEGLKKSLRDSGDEGEKLADKLDKVGKDAPAGLKAVDDVAKGLKDSLEGMGNSGGRVSGIIAKMGPYGLAAAAGLTILVSTFTAMAAAGEEAIRTISAIGDSADDVGLATDAYQSLKFALADVEETELNTVLSSLSKTTTELTLGNGQLHSALEQVNPELIKQIQSAGALDNKIIALQKAYQNTSSELERQVILNNSVSESNRGALQSLLELEGGLNGASDSAKKAGVVFSDDLIRAAQEADLRIDQANQRIEKSMTELKVTFSDVSVASKEAWAGLVGFVANNPVAAPIDNQIADLEKDLDSFQAKLGRVQSQIDKGITGPTNALPRSRDDHINSIAVIENEIEILKELRAERALARDLDAADAKNAAELSRLGLVLNRLSKEATTQAELRTKAEADLNAAIEKGLITDQTKIARLRSVIAEKYKDVDAIRARAKAARELAKRQAEQARAEAEGARIRAKLGDTTGVLSQREKELDALVGKGVITRDQANQTLQQYSDKLSGAAAARDKLNRALQVSLDPVERFNALTAEYANLQSLANIPAADFNRLMGQRAAALAKLEKTQSDQSERDQFGETLDDAQKRILESLLTADEVIEAKIEAEKAITDALVSAGNLSAAQAAKRLKEYRAELEGVKKETDSLGLSQQDYNDAIQAAKGGFGDFVDFALEKISELILQMVFAKDAQDALGSGGSGGGVGGFLSGLLGGGGSGSGSVSAGIAHKGRAQVGVSSGATRKISAAIFDDAPRAHDGRSQIGHDEHAFILQDGERVTSASDSRDLIQAINASTAMSAGSRGSGGQGVKFELINKGTPQSVDKVEESVDSAGLRKFRLEVVDIATRTTKQTIADGGADSVIKSRFGISAKASGLG